MAPKAEAGVDSAGKLGSQIMERQFGPPFPVLAVHRGECAQNRYRVLNVLSRKIKQDKVSDLLCERHVFVEQIEGPSGPSVESSRGESDNQRQEDQREKFQSILPSDSPQYDLYGKIDSYQKENDDGAKKGIGRSFWHDGDEALAMIWLRHVRKQKGKNAKQAGVRSYSPDQMPPFSQAPHKQGKEEDAIAWLKTFLKVAEVHELSEQNSFNLAFRVFNGPAFDWLCEEVPLMKKRIERWERWSQFLVRFAQCFVIRSGYNMRHQVRLRTQKKKEDVKAYYHSLIALAERIRPPIDDDFFKVEFMLGLRNPATQQVAKMAAAMDKSSQQVVDICIEFADREKRRKLREQIMAMKQLPKETVSAYAVNFEALALKMKPRMHDADLMDFFADGLRDESLRECVHRNLPRTLAEAVEIAVLARK